MDETTLLVVRALFLGRATDANCPVTSVQPVALAAQVMTLKAPAGTWSGANFTTLTRGAEICVPAGMSTAATTTSMVRPADSLPPPLLPPSRMISRNATTATTIPRTISKRLLLGFTSVAILTS